MLSGRKMPLTLEVDVQLPETMKVGAAATENGTVSGSLEPPRKSFGCQRSEVPQMVLRMLCLATSVAALTVMVTARESSTISFYGFQLPIYSKWSFSDSFEYLVAVSVAVAAHSLLQLVISTVMLLRKSVVITSRYHAWLIFAGDQVLAYAMMSAGSAATGVSNLNRTGIRHTSLPNFCKPLHSFCDHVAISIAFTFFCCFLLAVSVIQDVIRICNN